MSTPRIPAPLQSSVSPSGEARPVLRAKTIATRVTPDELAEVEAAAEGAGKTVAEWLRELVLKAARERPADPTEVLLAEVSALRYILLNLFHATAQANAEGLQSISPTQRTISILPSSARTGLELEARS